MADTATVAPRRSEHLQRSLMSGLLWLLVLNLLVKPLWLFGIEVGVQNAVGSEGYGFYFAIFNLSYIFNIALDLGITNFNTRNIARHPHLVDKHLSGILGVKVLLLGLYLTVTFSVGALLGYQSSQFYLLAWLCANQFLNSLLLYLRSNFEGLLLFRYDSLFSVLDRVLMIIICGILLWGPKCSLFDFHFSIFHFVYAQTAAYLITVTVALTLLLKRVKLRRPHFDRLFTLAILKQSFPFALLVLLMAGYNRIDPVMLQRLSPADTGNMNAGIYAGAFRLLDALTMVAYLASIPLLPVFSKMTHNLQRQPATNDELTATTRMMASLLLVFSVTAACALAAISHAAMQLLYDSHVDAYAAVFRVLVFCIIPISATYLFGTLLTAGGKLRILNLFAACSLIVNIIVNIICIPRWGAVGSAWAALLCQTLMAVAQIVAAQRLYRLQFSRCYISKILFFTLSIIGCAFAASHSAWWVALLLTSGVAVALAALLQLIDLRALLHILKNK